MAQLSAVAIVPHPSTSHSSPLWVYQVQPAHELPTLDLSITLKSHFLSAAARQRFDRAMRYRRDLMLIAYGCTTLLYIVVMVTPPRVAQGLSAVGLLLSLPGMLFIMSALRYDAIRVLLPTFDCIFFDTIVSSTLVVLMVMLHDARVLMVVQGLVAYQMNIFIDANIQALRRVALVNVFAMLNSVFVGLCITMGVTPQLHDFVLADFGSHKLDARTFVTNGFITVIAIMARNTFRKKALLFKRSTGAIVDCVSYRCHLKIEPFTSPPQHTARPNPSNAAVESSGVSPTPIHIQTMRYVGGLPLINASCVVMPRFFACLMEPTHARVKSVLFQALGFSSASLVIGVGTYIFANHERLGDYSLNEDDIDDNLVHDQRVQHVIIAAVGMTCLYVVACLALCQCKLLRAIATSFDFIFLSTQLTFVHVATADFFRWNRLTLLLVATWLWSHWVFCVDALTPVVRDRIGIRQLFIKMVMAALVTATGVLNHLLLYSDDTIRIYDRLLWKGTLLGRTVEFRLLASFYSTYVTVIAWALRLLWRIVTAKRNELVLLDGAVAYNNYLRQPAAMISSRLASRLVKPHAVATHTNGGTLIAVKQRPSST
jgi:hypothetical protein